MPAWMSRLMPVMLLVVAPTLVAAEPVLRTDFDTEPSALKLTAQSSGVPATAEIAAVGTIDTLGGTAPSAGVRLAVAKATADAWSAAAVLEQDGKFAETDPRKVTLSFMASVSVLQPITVRLETVDASGKTTGAATTEVYPAAPDFYQRYAMELSSLKSAGDALDLKADHVRISFGLHSEPGLPAGDRELRVDNLQLAGPSFYVSPTGSDTADGKTEATPLATPQKAIEKAQPGDIILLKGGEYDQVGDVVRILRPGTPAGWITVKNAPGETPVLKTHGWHAVRIGLGSKEQPNTEPGIAYVEIRGLHVVGNLGVDAAGGPTTPFPQMLGKAVAETNSNGILIEGRSSKFPVHHIRVADCTVTRNPGVGIASCYGDWVSFENNVTTDNSWFTVYATSGISILLGSQFDGTSGGYRFLVSGNRSSGNRCYQKWTASSNNDAPKKLSDGNGIIIDTLGGSAVAKNETHPPFTGRTLVVNNISFNNGGSGIHLVSSPNVDLVNNTTYLNGQTPETKYGQMFAYRSPGSNFVNNILVAPAGQKYNDSSSYGEAGNTSLIWSHNLFFGSQAALRKQGVADLQADPLFVNPTPDPRNADFTLRSGSPALGSGTRDVPNVPVPLVDIDGHRRPLDRNPSIGASQPE